MPRGCKFLTLIFCCLAGSGAFAEDAGRPVLTEEARVIYNEAVKLVNSKQEKEALPKLKRVVELSPEYAPAVSLYASNLLSDGQFSEALPVLRKATDLQPDWTNWYNLGVCYQYFGDLPNEVKAFRNALNISPNDPDAAHVEKIIKFAEAQMGDPTLFAASLNDPDYLKYMEEQGFVRWPTEIMPLRVYIKDGSSVHHFRTELEQNLKRAFVEWSNASEGLLKFVFDSDPKQAQIVCSWTDNRKDLPYANEAGHAIPTVTGGNNIKRVAVVLCTVSPSGAPLTDEQLYSTSLHELGHALGIGHSRNYRDVMFISESAAKSLSSRDKKTLIALYTMDKARLQQNPLRSSKAVQAGVESTPQLEVINLDNAAYDDISHQRYAEAQEKSKKALELKPGDESATNNLLAAYEGEAFSTIQHGDLIKGEQLYKRAIDFCRTKNKPDILKGMLTQYSSVLKSLGKIEEAKVADTEIAKLNQSK